MTTAQAKARSNEKKIGEQHQIEEELIGQGYESSNESFKARRRGIAKQRERENSSDSSDARSSQNELEAEEKAIKFINSIEKDAEQWT